MNAESMRAYIAGFFDGEGSALILTIKRGLKTGVIFQFRPVIKIAQKNREILDVVKAFLGFGHIDERSDKYQYHHFICNCHKDVSEFIRLIGPFVIVKKPQLGILSELIKLKSDYGLNRPYLKRIAVRMIDLRDELHGLNEVSRSNIKLKFSKDEILKESVFVEDVVEWNRKRCIKGLRAMHEVNRRRNGIE